MSLRSFRLIEELQRMFNETKSSQMPENAKEKSEEKKNPTLEKSKVIAEFRIIGQLCIEIIVLICFTICTPLGSDGPVYFHFYFISAETRFKQRN